MIMKFLLKNWKRRKRMLDCSSKPRIEGKLKIKHIKNQYEIIFCNSPETCSFAACFGLPAAGRGGFCEGLRPSTPLCIQRVSLLFIPCHGRVSGSPETPPGCAGRGGDFMSPGLDRDQPHYISREFLFYLFPATGRVNGSPESYAATLHLSPA